MKIAKRIIGLLFLGMILFSCKKNDGLTWDDIYTTGGIINAKIVGLSNDSISLNETFTANKYSSGTINNDATYSKRGNDYSFNLRRASDNFGDNSIELEFTKNNTGFSNFYLNVHYAKILENGKVLVLSLYNSYNVNNFQISNFTFDEATGKIKGNYSYLFVGTHNNKITLTGDFDLNVIQVYN